MGICYSFFLTEFFPLGNLDLRKLSGKRVPTPITEEENLRYCLFHHDPWSTFHHLPAHFDSGVNDAKIRNLVGVCLWKQEYFQADWVPGSTAGTIEKSAVSWQQESFPCQSNFVLCWLCSNRSNSWHLLSTHSVPGTVPRISFLS